MKLNRNNLGLAAEAQGLQFLLQQGLTLLARNFSCRFGEIDLIMLHANTVVFVEVRLRSNTRFASAGDSIHYHKQQKLVRAAQYYLQQHATSMPCRFDALLFDAANQAIPTWIRNAIDT